MSSKVGIDEILETVDMIAYKHLNIRTVTLGLNVLDAASPSPGVTRRRVVEKMLHEAGGLAEAVDEISGEYGIEIVNSRIALTPLAIVTAPLVASVDGARAKEELVELAKEIDGIAGDIGIDLVGGYGALVHKGETVADRVLIASIPDALTSTGRICSSINVADTRSGINVDAIAMLGHVISEVGKRSPEGHGAACARLMVLANAPEDNPFMAGGFHGLGSADKVVNVGVSGPAVLLAAIRNAPDLDLRGMAELVKRTAFKITRLGELVGREIALRIGAEFGAVDLSLAPAPAPNESVARILEAMGVESMGLPGSVGALMILVDSIKKGGVMAASRTGGFSGAFIPVSEDPGMSAAVSNGTLTISGLLALTAVSATGLDMVPIPGDTPPDVISSLILDQVAIGVAVDKSVGVRLIPVPGAKPGDKVNFGGLFGEGVVVDVPHEGSGPLLARGGRVPPSLLTLRN